MTAPDGLPARPSRLHLALGVVAALEIVSLLTLLINLATVHDRALAQIVGPVHGTLYLLGIAATFLTTTSTRARLLSIVPSVGAVLAWQLARNASRAPGR